jgi:hypothetical protein
MKNGVFWDVTLAAVRTEVPEEFSASIIRVTRIGDYEEFRLLVYKNPVRTSLETHYVSATEPCRTDRAVQCAIFCTQHSHWDRLSSARSSVANTALRTLSLLPGQITPSAKGKLI